MTKRSRESFVTPDPDALSLSAQFLNTSYVHMDAILHRHQMLVNLLQERIDFAEGRPSKVRSVNVSRSDPSHVVVRKRTRVLTRVRPSVPVSRTRHFRSRTEATPKTDPWESFDVRGFLQQPGLSDVNGIGNGIGIGRKKQKVSPLQIREIPPSQSGTGSGSGSGSGSRHRLGPTHIAIDGDLIDEAERVGMSLITTRPEEEEEEEEEKFDSEPGVSPIRRVGGHGRGHGSGRGRRRTNILRRQGRGRGRRTRTRTRNGKTATSVSSMQKLDPSAWGHLIREREIARRKELTEQTVLELVRQLRDQYGENTSLEEVAVRVVSGDMNKLWFGDVVTAEALRNRWRRQRRFAEEESEFEFESESDVSEFESEYEVDSNRIGGERGEIGADGKAVFQKVKKKKTVVVYFSPDDPLLEKWREEVRKLKDKKMQQREEQEMLELSRFVPSVASDSVSVSGVSGSDRGQRQGQGQKQKSRQKSPMQSQKRQSRRPRQFVTPPSRRTQHDDDGRKSRRRRRNRRNGEFEDEGSPFAHLSPSDAEVKLARRQMTDVEQGLRDRRDELNLLRRRKEKCRLNAQIRIGRVKEFRDELEILLDEQERSEVQDRSHPPPLARSFAADSRRESLEENIDQSKRELARAINESGEIDLKIRKIVGELESLLRTHEEACMTQSGAPGQILFPNSPRKRRLNIAELRREMLAVWEGLKNPRCEFDEIFIKDMFYS